MAEKGFVEVETPTMQAIAGGAAARPFITHHNTLDIDLFLRIAPELYLKRLLVGGMERVFEIGRVYRNEGISPKHNPEFTMMEAYQAYGDYHAMMDLTEALICGSIEALGGGYQRPWGESTIDFTPPWPRRTYAELLAEHAGVDPADLASVKARAEEKGIATAGKDPDVVMSELFEEVVEDRLTGPIFVIDYPAAICPLTKRKAANPAVAERFELYVAGHGAGQRLHRAQRSALAGAALPQPARGTARGRVDGQDGRRLRPGPQARHAAGRRAGHRHRPALHDPDEPAEHPRRDPVSAHAAAIAGCRGSRGDPEAEPSIQLTGSKPVATTGESSPSQPREGVVDVYKYLLCWRYLRTRYIALASVISVMLGVATMIVVNSVMAGFSDKMRDRLHGVLADLVVESASMDGFDNFEEVMARVQEAGGEDIVAMAPTMETPGILKYRVGSGSMTRPVQIIGVRPAERAKTGDFAEFLFDENGEKVPPSFEVPERLKEISPAGSPAQGTRRGARRRIHQGL